MRAKSIIFVASAVGLAAAFAWLGQWQLRRADESTALERRFAAFAAGPPLVALPDAAAAGDLRYRTVALHGKYLAEPQVLLDNMTDAGVAGYHVLTPFMAAADGVVLVNRGFVPALPSRSDLPDVAVATDERTVHGRIDMFPKPALRLAGRDDGEDRAVRVLSFPDAEDLERVLGMPVAPYQILLDAAEPDGFVRAWAPSGVGAERNLAYAGQWFALSVATLVAALVWLLKSRVRERGR